MPGKNTFYDNFVIENIIEDLFASKLDLQTLVTVDNTLQTNPGMQIKVHRYNGTSATQDLAIGEGNTQSIVASYTEAPYTIKLAQNRFEYYDEEALSDPVVIEAGLQKQAADLFDHVNNDIYAEYAKGTQTADGTTSIFDGIVDAQALINEETTEPGEGTYIIVNPKDLAKIRKELKDTIQYVDAFASVASYVGHVANSPIFVKKNATEGTLYVATPKAVTIFVKSGTEVEMVDKNNRSETAANTRLNSIFARKYYVAALTDNSQVVKVSLTNG